MASVWNSPEGCYSFGNTIEEAKNNIGEAIELYLDDMPEMVKLYRG
jgi:predicted RNase H-like HicB family nuclease